VNSSLLPGLPCSTAISAPAGKIAGAGPHCSSGPRDALDDAGTERVDRFPRAEPADDVGCCEHALLELRASSATTAEVVSRMMSLGA
jgi:hypothetical protein